ncbi:hypothetical protein JUN65_08255 [Gluconacetobacter azotocaptans]|uniref:hypothetical protein n=1 Tax=Gluconacetobacter azotocaptans TaxID=142834 RepID=UPI00195EBD96|nr:hypothetical protein [Gluconacetobacter azotocaptans]MBM9401577.1 hypothetical protein [Gluconacetobacter azotocaptans]
MARIRTIHPGLYTDEAFATLSMAARVLIIGIWSHADDGGGFEWKPLTLKMRVFPADMLDVAPLLEELVQNNIVMKYDVDGKTYGAVRNFGKWQRPKKPSRFVPMPESVRDFSCTNDAEKGSCSKTVENEGPMKDPEMETSSELVPNHSVISETEGRKVGREEERTLTSFVTPAEPSSQAVAIVEPGIVAPPLPTGGGLRSPVDARSALWSIGATALHHMTGKPPKACKSLIGKWLRDIRDDCAGLNLILLEACETRPIDPEAWIAGAVRARSGGREADRARRWNLNDIDLDAAAEVDMRQMGMIP